MSVISQIKVCLPTMPNL